MFFLLGIVLSLLHWCDCKTAQELLEPVVIYPESDAVVIKQDQRVVGSIETLDIFGGTHFAFLLFDIVAAKDLVQMYIDNNKNPVDIKMRFVINWAPNVGSQLSLCRATFPGLTQWDERGLDFLLTEKAEIGPEVGVTFIPRDDWFIEFDVREDIMAWLAKCDMFRPECRYLTFRLSTPDPQWVKVYSNNAYKQKYRPQLVFSESSFALSVPIVADTGVVRQIPEHGFGQWPTLDLIFYTHVGFLQFNLVEMLGHIQSIHHTTRIKLRMSVEWAQAAWGNVIAEIVDLGSPLDENKFKWGDAERPEVVVTSRIGSEHVCSGCIVEFDLTPLFTVQSVDSTERRLNLPFRDLANFQIRLRTEQNAWVKLASKEYHDASKRPAIVFSQIAWQDYLKPWATIFWTIYFWVIPPLHPLLLGIALAGIIQSTRKLVGPVIQFTMSYVKLRQSKLSGKNVVLALSRSFSGNLTGLSPKYKDKEEPQIEEPQGPRRHLRRQEFGSGA